MHHSNFFRYAVKHLGMGAQGLEEYARENRPDLRGFTPAVIEERQLNVAQMDVFSRLMMDRIIFIGLPIDDYVSNVVQAQLLFLESVDPKRDIQIFINSPGGSVLSGMGIHDTMQHVTPEVSTICTGMAASMAAVLLAAGAKGKRSALPHSRVMIHQPHGGAQGQVSDLEITYRLFKEMQKEIYEILSSHTGQPYEKIERDCDRDNWMKAEEAKAYGLIDEVLEKTASAR
jgi:ATP-dependent Clp protease protease subunit